MSCPKESTAQFDFLTLSLHNVHPLCSTKNNIYETTYLILVQVASLLRTSINHLHTQKNLLFYLQLRKLNWLVAWRLWISGKPFHRNKASHEVSNYSPCGAQPHVLYTDTAPREFLGGSHIKKSKQEYNWQQHQQMFYFNWNLQKNNNNKKKMKILCYCFKNPAALSLDERRLCVCVCVIRH